MPFTEPEIPVHVRLLANRQGKPGALLWQTRNLAAPALCSWLQLDSVADLARNARCLWRQDDLALRPPEVQQALTDAGFQAVDAAAIADGVTRLEADNNVLWVAGPWYLQAPPKANSAQTASRTNALRLVQLINSDAETHDIEDVFRHDAQLSYQLLRLVNSAGMARGRTINSFAQAILILGRQPLRRWVNLLMFSARDDDPRSAMLMAHVVLRARGMELLAQAAGLDRSQQDQAFMTGMFSLLGVLFGQPLAQALAPLNLQPELRAALLEGRGELDPLLRAWCAAEQADDAVLAAALADMGLSVSDFNRTLPAACAWMWQMTSEAASP